MAPNTTFEFEVAVADAGTFNDRNKNQVVYKGIDGGFSPLEEKEVQQKLIQQKDL